MWWAYKNLKIENNYINFITCETSRRKMRFNSFIWWAYLLGWAYIKSNSIDAKLESTIMLNPTRGRGSMMCGVVVQWCVSESHNRSSKPEGSWMRNENKNFRNSSFLLTWVNKTYRFPTRLQKEQLMEVNMQRD